jgi:hypothetical protein
MFVSGALFRWVCPLFKSCHILYFLPPPLYCRIPSWIKPTVLSYRAEKDKAQFGAELNDLRAGVDHLSNEKVF